MKRLRIAFFSPFNPQKSGVSDYSEELLPHLAELADVEIIADSYRLSNDTIRRTFIVRTAQEFLRDSSRYDAAIYQIANSIYHHGYMIPCLRAKPGIVVMHDFYLHYLMLGLTLMRGDMEALLQILQPVYGATARSVAWRLLLGAADPYGIPLAWPLLAMSRGVVTHNHHASELMAAYMGDKPVRVIPMGVPLPNYPADTAALKAKYGFGSNDFLLASVSTISYNKRTLEALKAVAALRERFGSLRYVMLGGGLLGEEARSFMRQAGIENVVRHTGWIPMEAYNEILAASDAVLDLRYPSGAETSASLTRAIAAGKPVIVSAQGSFLELPDDFAFKIPVGETGQERLREAIARLITSTAERERMCSAARHFAKNSHTLEKSARAYIDFVEQVVEAPPAPVMDWNVGRTGRFALAGYAALYRLGRLGYLLRTYGVADTLRRIRDEARLRRPASGLDQPEKSLAIS